MTEHKKRVLILFAHPALQKSRVNRRLAEGVRHLECVTFHDLYETYPELDIDVPREQALMEDHELIVFQHPFFWYSTPAMLKEWQDLVLEHGWAYGSKGTALRGKKLLNVVTTGGSEDTYQHNGFHEHTMVELLAPIAQTAVLCGMEFLPPFVVHGTHRLTEEEIAVHAEDYRRVVEAYCSGKLDLEAAREHQRLNSALNEIIGS